MSKELDGRLTRVEDALRNEGMIIAHRVASAIAARDKWWVGLLQEVNEANDLKDLQERFAHLLRYVADLGIK